MPFISKAQKRKWQELLGQKLISQEQFDKMLADTPEDLPEYGGKRPPVAVIRRPKRVHKG